MSPVKTVLDVPDDVANELLKQAGRRGHNRAVHLLEVVGLGLVMDRIPAAAVEQMARSPGLVVSQPAGSSTQKLVSKNSRVAVSAAPVTGMLTIDSPADASIRAMTPDQVLALTELVPTEGDVERTGVLV